MMPGKTNPSTRYIQALETRLLDRLREQGLPARLAKMRGEGGEEGEEGERSEEEEEGDELLGLVHRTLGEEVASKVEEQREEDTREEERLVREGLEEEVRRNDRGGKEKEMLMIMRKW